MDSRPATGYPVHPNANGQPPPPGTAYPYHAPPPHTNPYYYNNNPNSYPHQYYQNPRGTLIRRVIISAIGVTLIFFIILFIIWLVVRPRLPNFQINSVSLTNFNVSSQSVTGNWHVKFEVYNPNKKLKVSYDELQCWLFYRSDFLSQTTLKPFKQDTKEVTDLDAVFSVVDSYIEGKAASGIDRERKSGSVGFNLKFRSILGFRVGGLRARRRLLTVYCDDVVIKLSGMNGNFTAGPKRCRVYA